MNFHATFDIVFELFDQLWSKIMRFDNLKIHNFNINIFKSEKHNQIEKICH